MGYNTTYTLNVEDDLTFIIGELMAYSDEADYCLMNNGETNNKGKWYDHEADLKHISAKYPNTIFTLYGEGDDPGDIWYKYFKGGRMQISKAIITLEPFNENLLK